MNYYNQHRFNRIKSGILGLLAATAISGAIYLGVKQSDLEEKIHSYPEYSIANDIGEIMKNINFVSLNLKYYEPFVEEIKESNNGIISTKLITSPEKFPNCYDAKLYLSDVLNLINEIDGTNNIKSYLNRLYDSLPYDKEYDGNPSYLISSNYKKYLFQIERNELNAINNQLFDLREKYYSTIPKTLVDNNSYALAGFILTSTLGFLFSISSLYYKFKKIKLD